MVIFCKKGRRKKRIDLACVYGTLEVADNFLFEGNRQFAIADPPPPPLPLSISLPLLAFSLLRPQLPSVLL
jgi:hypothetical protein